MWGRVLVALFVLLALGVGLVAALGIELVGREAIAADAQSDRAASVDELESAHDAVFGPRVYADGVDWAAMSAEPAELRALGALYARSGPRSGSEGASGHDAVLAFRINAYAALVALGIVEQTLARGAPLSSVDDVHGVLDPGDGFGFFTAQLLVLDGSLTNLADLERTILRDEDPRVLGLLHDGTRATPPPPRRAVRAETLEQTLVAAGHTMTAPPYVTVDDAERVIVLAPWYQTHRVRFEGHAQRVGELPTLMAWVVHHAHPDVRAPLERAAAAGYGIRYAAPARALSSRTR